MIPRRYLEGTFSCSATRYLGTVSYATGRIYVACYGGTAYRTEGIKVPVEGTEGMIYLITT